MTNYTVHIFLKRKYPRTDRPTRLMMPRIVQRRIWEKPLLLHSPEYLFLSFLAKTDLLFLSDGWTSEIWKKGKATVPRNILLHVAKSNVGKKANIVPSCEATLAFSSSWTESPIGLSRRWRMSGLQSGNANYPARAKAQSALTSTSTGSCISLVTLLTMLILTWIAHLQGH